MKKAVFVILILLLCVFCIVLVSCAQKESPVVADTSVESVGEVVYTEKDGSAYRLFLVDGAQAATTEAVCNALQLQEQELFADEKCTIAVDSNVLSSADTFYIRQEVEGVVSVVSVNLFPSPLLAAASTLTMANYQYVWLGMQGDSAGDLLYYPIAKKDVISITFATSAPSWYNSSLAHRPTDPPAEHCGVIQAGLVSDTSITRNDNLKMYYKGTYSGSTPRYTLQFVATSTLYLPEDSNSMFCDFPNLTTLTFGSGVSTQNVKRMDYMFGGNKALTTLNLSSFNTSNVESMASMFAGCGALTSLTLGSNWNTAKVKNYFSMFAGLSAITSLPLSTFTSSAIEDSRYMFADCTALTTTNLPAAFAPKSGTDCEGMWRGCSALGSLNLSSYAVLGENMCQNCSALTSVTLPSITKLPFGIFVGCSSLSSITIPVGVTSIGQEAFRGCSALSAITYPGTFNQWVSISGLNNMMSYGATSKTLSVNGSAVQGSFTIPSGITSIAAYSLYGISAITSITIPVSVTSIGDSALRNCSGLTAITYLGTKNQWKSVSKSSNWNTGAGTTTVTCSDGNA